jgi:hypothetical protein
MVHLLGGGETYASVCIYARCSAYVGDGNFVCLLGGRAFRLERVLYRGNVPEWCIYWVVVRPMRLCAFTRDVARMSVTETLFAFWEEGRFVLSGCCTVVRYEA